MSSDLDLKQFREKLATDKNAHAMFTKDLSDLLKKHGVADKSLTTSAGGQVAIVITSETGSTKSKSFIITAD